MASISIQELEKSFARLEEAIALYNIETSAKLKLALRDAVIQRFEFTSELSWKVCLKVLGLPAMAPKPAIREMVQSGMIKSAELWFDFVEARNKSSHSYDEDIAKSVLEKVLLFVPEAKDLIKNLNKK
jgi:nucleotidyltransferase substrate binding protein (TIGR01987 family)